MKGPISVDMLQGFDGQPWAGDLDVRFWREATLRSLPTRSLAVDTAADTRTKLGCLVAGFPEGLSATVLRPGHWFCPSRPYLNSQERVPCGLICMQRLGAIQCMPCFSSASTWVAVRARLAIASVGSVIRCSKQSLCCGE